MSEPLVVVSKVKKFIKTKSDMMTSNGSIEVLTKIVEEQLTQAIASAIKDGRKTVMARDFVTTEVNVLV